MGEAGGKRKFPQTISLGIFTGEFDWGICLGNFAGKLPA
jgi:hypothetical protein